MSPSFLAASEGEGFLSVRTHDYMITIHVQNMGNNYLTRALEC